MDCHEIGKYAGAFADGELPGPLSQEVETHLAGCARCSRRVAGVSDLKAALSRVYPEVRAPQELRDAVSQRLDSVAHRPVDTVSRRRADRGPWSRRVRWAVPVGLAAALLMAAVAIQSWRVRGPRVAGGSFVRAEGLADAIQQHRLCLQIAGTHHDPDLPRELNAIAQRLGRDLSLAVLAPDLSAEGYSLLGADRCGIMGRPGSHVLYRSSAGDDLVSVFTVARWEQLGTGLRPNGSGRGLSYFVCSDRPFQAVAWHNGLQTYVLCGELDESQLVDLAAKVRVADAGKYGTPDLKGIVAMYQPDFLSREIVRGPGRVPVAESRLVSMGWARVDSID